MSDELQPGSPEDAIDVPGLAADVEIRIDASGIPHIYAQSRDDAYLAQGFNAARDRLFQIDLWRRRGHGLLSEVFGEAYVEQDAANRLLLYRGDMAVEWAAYGAGVREAVESFVAGVNAYIEWACADPVRLPPEFGLYDYLPSRWDPADVVRFRTHGLFYNVEQEVARARTVHLAGAAADELRQAREPADPLVVPDGIDWSLIDEGVLRTYRLAFAPVSFDGTADPASAIEGVSGSNNWVVDGSRTDTGRPILANDPHRAVTLPSLRYVAHLVTPDLDVIGAGEPGLPGISIGHNERVAFGLTIWPADVEDLYVYRLDPEDAERYLTDRGWQQFERAEESVPVRGTAPRVVGLRFAEHGPVIHHDPERGIAIALRAVWLEAGMAPYVASLGYGDARDGDEFIAALDRWGAPAVNQVFATVDGDWGWQVAARIPRREGWDGSMPVAGDSGREWRGFVTSSELPSERRPDRGWIATANEENLPADWTDRGLTATYDWYSGARARRLREWLAEDDSVSVARSADMQMDELSVHMRELLGLLSAFPPAAPSLAREFDALIGWDGHEGADSREALIAQIWVRRHLRERLVRERLTADGVQGAALEEAVSLLLTDESFGGDLRGELILARWMGDALGDAACGLLVEETLRAAIAEIEDRLGSEADGPWAWGRLHHSSVTHPAFARRADKVDPSWVALGPTPRGGSGDTVGMAGYDAGFRQSIGSTFRMVLDVGDWDRSVAMNSPGQSGDPRSTHYGDLFGPWVAGETFPLVYSRAAVEARTARILRLRASGRTGVDPAS
ncbi:penicillin acylase family protein [Leucobacter ruminantium]|uniref:Penicillin acylase family protein n=1 Tax=Leucobacter ruminantium TaxID=1289170 RepID=A0A939LTS5_9MICO|nr:penicillin acylase family protein [Leucobacter ruminantium]MBO1803971.1 penicillin acylase family protein [Leucobacter ruminantium]